MAENNSWKFNWQQVPWVTGDAPAGTVKETPAAKPAGESKKLEKPPPQASVESIEIDTSQEIKEDFPYSGSGKLKVLEGATLTELRLHIQPLYRYRSGSDAQDKEENREQATAVLVDKKTLTFKFKIDCLFEPNAYYLDKEKAADAKYRLLVKVVGPQLDKDYFSKEVELPMESKAVILKKGCYDDVWADAKKDQGKFPKSGEKYVPGNAIKKLQGYLIQFNFLSKNTDDGYYGDGTETAVKQFQECSSGQKRSGSGKDKMFYIMMGEITFQGSADGVYGPKTEKEVGVWLREEFVRPVEVSTKDDSDISVTYSGSIKHIPEKAIKVLKKLLKEANISSVIITSTVRTPDDQARIMYNNILSEGIKAQRELYGTGGNQVIDEYSRLKKLGNSEKEIKEGMKEKIVAIGPTTVSKHCCDQTNHSIFDIAPSSIKPSQKKAFVDAIKKAKGSGEIFKYFLPPGDPAYHLEVIL